VRNERCPASSRALLGASFVGRDRGQRRRQRHCTNGNDYAAVSREASSTDSGNRTHWAYEQPRREKETLDGDMTPNSACVEVLPAEVRWLRDARKHVRGRRSAPSPRKQGGQSRKPGRVDANRSSGDRIRAS